MYRGRYRLSSDAFHLRGPPACRCTAQRPPKSRTGACRAIASRPCVTYPAPLPGAERQRAGTRGYFPYQPGPVSISQPAVPPFPAPPLPSLKMAAAPPPWAFSRNGPPRRVRERGEARRKRKRCPPPVPAAAGQEEAAGKAPPAVRRLPGNGRESRGAVSDWGRVRPRAARCSCGLTLRPAGAGGRSSPSSQRRVAAATSPLGGGGCRACRGGRREPRACPRWAEGTALTSKRRGGCEPRFMRGKSPISRTDRTKSVLNLSPSFVSRCWRVW